MQEEWRPIAEFPAYEISNLGHVRNSATGLIRRPTFAGQGYAAINFKIEGRTASRYIHRMMWIAFRGEIPPGHQIDHINGDRTGNTLPNLDCVTAKENKRRAVEKGLYAHGQSHGWALHPELIPRGPNHYRVKDPTRGPRGETGNAKLTERQVRAIRRRRANGESCASLAVKYGVSKAQVFLIVARKSWAHVA